MQRRPPAPLTSIKNDQKCAHLSQKYTLPGNDCGLRGPKLHTYFPKINPVPVRRAPPKANRDCTKASRNPASDSHSDFRAFRQVAPPSITTPLGNILIKAPLSTRSWLRGFSDCFISAPSRVMDPPKKPRICIFQHVNTTIRKVPKIEWSVNVCSENRTSQMHKMMLVFGPLSSVPSAERKTTRSAFRSIRIKMPYSLC